MRKLFINFVLLAAGLLVGTNAWGATTYYFQVNGSKYTTLNAALEASNGSLDITQIKAYTLPAGTYDFKGVTLDVGSYYLQCKVGGDYTIKNATITGVGNASYGQIYQSTAANNIVLDNVQMTTTGTHCIYNAIASATLVLRNNSSASLKMNKAMTSISVEDGSSLNLISGTFTKVTFTGLENCTITGGTFAIASLETVRSKMAEGKYLFRKSSTCVVSTEDKATAQIGQEKFLLLADAFACVTDGATINLLAPVTEVLTISKNITIDLNGNSITGTSDKNVFTLSTANKTLTLKNSGAAASITTQRSNTNTCYVATLTRAARLVVEGDITMDASATDGKSINMGAASASALLGANVTASVNAASSSDIVAMPNSHVTIVGGTLENCKLAEGTTLATSVVVSGGYYGFDATANLSANKKLVPDYCDELGNCYKVKGDGPKVASVNGGELMSLEDALVIAQDNDVITLSNDLTLDYLPLGECLNITESITLDGDGHTISGWGSCKNVNTHDWKKSPGPEYFQTTIAINVGGSSKINVTLKNMTIENNDGHSIYTQGNLSSLTIENCKIITSSKGLFIGGKQTDAANITVNNTEFECGSTGWAIIAYNPINLQMENSTTKGWNAVTFKGPWQPNNEDNVNNCEGSHGSTATLVNCDFDATNYLSGGSNGYAVFVVEDDDIDIHLTDCGMNAEALGNAQQVLFGPADYPHIRSKENPIRLTIDGNNSHLNGLFYNVCATYYPPLDGVPAWKTEIIVKGGTYSENPSNAAWNLDSDPEENPDAQINDWKNFVPEGYEVSEVTQYVEGKDPVTLYRVHPKAAKDEHGVAYKLNDDVEEKGGGQNPTTSFILSADETVAADKTYAEYVEVQSGTITIPTGKVLNVGEAGLVVKDGAKIEVEAGGVLTVSKGGTISAKDESIIIGADAVNGAGSYLVDPAVTFNQQPKATVKMTANIGKQGSDYTWHRFAMPVNGLEKAWGKKPDKGTYLYGWDYDKKDWKNMAGSTNMEPFQGYTVTTDEMTPGEMVFTFEGNLVGNVKSNIDFTTIGYGYFGNSYTGYILAKTMLADFQDIEGVEGQVWMWDAANQSYSGVSLTDLLRDRDLEPFQREIAPMHTFILKTNSGEGATIDIDYMAAIWGNPRYELVDAPASAPARAMDADDAFIGIKVVSANGAVDRIRMTENAENSDMYENSVDATKYMNENSINLYATVDGEDYTSLYTDNLLGKKLTLQTMDEVNYTLLVNDVIGSEYALQDMLTGEIISLQAGKTYSFSAQPNSTVERFQIVSARTMPTGTDKIVATKAAKGIYTMLGQYMGEASDWNKLPAGAYLVDGVKIVK